jgi:transposase
MKNKLVNLIVKKVKTIPKLYKSFDFSNIHQKFTLNDYLDDILYVLKTGIAWRDLRSNINWNSVYKIYCKLVEFKVIEQCYQDLIKKYCLKSSQSKLKVIMTDTTFIPNKHGIELIGYNTYYNKKNGTKISLISDSNGNPLNVECYTGNKYDCKILENHLDKISGDNPITYNHKTEYNRYFLADAGYDSKKIRDKLTKLGFISLIARNKRNSKKPTKKLTKKERTIFKKRLKIENMIKKIKDNKRLINRYDNKIEIFKGFIYLALSKIICNKLFGVT